MDCFDTTTNKTTLTSYTPCKQMQQTKQAFVDPRGVKNVRKRSGPKKGSKCPTRSTRRGDMEEDEDEENSVSAPELSMEGEAAFV